MLMPVESDYSDVSITLRWEPSLLERLAIIPTFLGLFLVFAHIIDSLFFDGNGLTWIKVAATMWLPKPILDEKNHKERSEKRVSEYSVSSVERVQGVSATTSLHSQDQDITQSVGMSGDEIQSEILEIPPEMLETIEDESLLRSWFTEQGELNDSWASRIFRRRKK
jgi:hypothetical protein